MTYITISERDGREFAFTAWNSDFQDSELLSYKLSDCR
jgi:hypothetical protein